MDSRVWLRVAPMMFLAACGGEEEDPPTPPPVAAVSAPAAAPPGLVRITVTATSTPPGATVTGGGRLLGTTPLTAQVTAPAPPPGQSQSFAFTFQLDGHQTATVNATAVNDAITVGAALTPVEAAPAAPAAPVLDPAAVPFDSNQVWRGSYVCSQGSTALVLRITEVRGRRVEATFDFEYRPGRTRGAFAMSGTYDPTTRRLSLDPGRWIQRPGPSWQTVGMSGRVDESGTTYSGRITRAEGCASFRVRR